VSSDALVRLALGLAAVVASGCSQPRGVVFEPLDPPLRWPGPPEPARIEYVGALATDADLKPGRSFGTAIGDTLFGASASRSMLTPYGVCTDGGDRLFVSDSNAQVIHVFDLESRGYERWPGGDTGGLSQPLGVAWDPAGRLLVADGAAARIAVLDGSGRPAGVLGEGALQRPTGIALGDGVIYVADAAAHEVVVLDAGGVVQRRLGGRGSEPGRFNYPTNVAVDAAGRLYVADSLNFRVQVLDDAGQPLRQVGSQGDRPGYFSQPKGVAVGRHGRLYVVDAHFEAVQVFDEAGQLLLSFGHEGTGPGEFWLPAGVHVDGQDRIWVADSYNRRVQVFRTLETGGARVEAGP